MPMIILGVIAAAILLVLALIEREKEEASDLKAMLENKRNQIQTENERKAKCKKKI